MAFKGSTLCEGNSKMYRTICIIVGSLFSTCFPSLVQAQEEPPPLVVCCSRHIEDTVARLAGAAVRVERFTDESAEAISYVHGDARARELLTTADLVVQNAHGDMCHQFWAERLRVNGVAVDCVTFVEGDRCRATLLCQTHAVLARRFPEKREVFGRRLNDELRRMRNRQRAYSLADSHEADLRRAAPPKASLQIQYVFRK